MSTAYTRLCDKAKSPVDAPEVFPDPALWLWERLGKHKARRGYTLDLVRQIWEAEQARPLPERIPLDPETRRRLDKLGRAIARHLQ